MESVFLKPLMGLGERMLTLCFTHSDRCGTSVGSWAPAGWGQQGLSVGFAEWGVAVSLFLSNEVSCAPGREKEMYQLGVQAEPLHYPLLIDKTEA